jgi:hypothetical protein
MLVVTVELWPHGNKYERFTIGQLEAANITKRGSQERYQVTISQEPQKYIPIKGWKSEFVVVGHNRSDGAWKLVSMILENAFLEHLVTNDPGYLNPNRDPQVLREMPMELQDHLIKTHVQELKFLTLVREGRDAGYWSSLSDYANAVQEHAQRFSTKSGWG